MNNDERINKLFELRKKIHLEEKIPVYIGFPRSPLFPCICLIINASFKEEVVERHDWVKRTKLKSTYDRQVIKHELFDCYQIITKVEL